MLSLTVHCKCKIYVGYLDRIFLLKTCPKTNETKAADFFSRILWDILTKSFNNFLKTGPFIFLRIPPELYTLLHRRDHITFSWCEMSVYFKLVINNWRLFCHFYVNFSAHTPQTEIRLWINLKHPVRIK